MHPLASGEGSLHCHLDWTYQCQEVVSPLQEAVWPLPFPHELVHPCLVWDMRLGRITLTEDVFGRNFFTFLDFVRPWEHFPQPRLVVEKVVITGNRFDNTA